MIFYCLYIVFVIATLVRALISNISLFFVLRWLRRKSNEEWTDQSYQFVVIIPVLYEQKVIEKTLRHFLKMDYPKQKVHILVVSTEKEEVREGNILTTSEVVDAFARKVNQDFQQGIIKRVHYPYKEGKMADQINYALDYIKGSFFVPQDQLFIALYNADSRPHLRTFSCVSTLANSSGGRIFQQSSLFFDNWDAISRAKNYFEKMYLLANGTLHSRWTLVHELPRLFRQSFSLKYLNKRLFLSHCVGHGLFLREDVLSDIKKIPVGTVTEDLFLGYVVSLLGEPINPLPLLESAEMPNTSWGALKQKYVWFFGPLDHFSYHHYFQKFYKNRAGFILRHSFTLQGILPAFIWLFQGWILLYILFYPIIVKRYDLLIVSIFVCLFYAPLSYYFTTRLFKESQYKKELINILLFSIPASIIHSLPPIASIYAKIKSFITKKEPNKPKTER